MKRLLIRDSLSRGHFLYLDRVILHFKMSEIFDISSPLPEQNIPIH